MKKILIILVLLLSACDRTDHEAANRAAQEYMTHIPHATSVECADQDTDGDGYVTCTVFRGDLEPMPIQCGSEKYCYNCARGCKYVPFYGGSKKRAD